MLTFADCVLIFVVYCITDESRGPAPGQPDPVGVASAKHTGTQLIELMKTDKDFIAVSEEVRKRGHLSQLPSSPSYTIG